VEPRIVLKHKYGACPEVLAMRLGGALDCVKSGLSAMFGTMVVGSLKSLTRRSFLTYCLLGLSAVLGCEGKKSSKRDESGETSNGENPEERALAQAKAALANGGSPHDVVELTNGLTRMHVAARDGYAKVLGFLIDRGGDVSVHDGSGKG